MAFFPGALYMFNQGRKAFLLLIAMVIGIPGAENPDPHGDDQGAESGQGNQGQVERSDDCAKSDSKTRNEVKQAENSEGKETENLGEIETEIHVGSEVEKHKTDAAEKRRAEQSITTDSSQEDTEQIPHRNEDSIHEIKHDLMTTMGCKPAHHEENNSTKPNQIGIQTINQSDEVIGSESLKEPEKEKLDRVNHETGNSEGEFEVNGVRNGEGHLEKVEANGKRTLEKVEANWEGNLEEGEAYIEQNGEGNFEQVEANGEGNLEQVEANLEGNLEHVEANVLNNGKGNFEAVETSGEGNLEQVEANGERKLEEVEANGEGNLGHVEANIVKNDGVNLEEDEANIEKNGEGNLEAVKANGEENLEKTEANGEGNLKEGEGSIEINGEGNLEEVEANGEGILEQVEANIENNGEGNLEEVEANGERNLEEDEANVIKNGEGNLKMVEGNDVKTDIGNNEGIGLLKYLWSFASNTAAEDKEEKSKESPCENEADVDEGSENGQGSLEEVEANGEGNLEQVEANGEGNLEAIKAYGEGNLEEGEASIEMNGEGNLEEAEANGEGNLEQVEANIIKNDGVNLEEDEANIEKNGEGNSEEVGANGEGNLEQVEAGGDRNLEEVEANIGNNGEGHLEQVEAAGDRNLEEVEANIENNGERNVEEDEANVVKNGEGNLKMVEANDVKTDIGNNEGIGLFKYLWSFASNTAAEDKEENSKESPCENEADVDEGNGNRAFDNNEEKLDNCKGTNNLDGRWSNNLERNGERAAEKIGTNIMDDSKSKNLTETETSPPQEEITFAETDNPEKNGADGSQETAKYQETEAADLQANTREIPEKNSSNCANVYIVTGEDMELYSSEDNSDSSEDFEDFEVVNYADCLEKPVEKSANKNKKKQISGTLKPEDDEKWEDMETCNVLLQDFVITGVDGADKEPSSLEHVHRSELFPPKQLVRDEDSLHVHVPFPPLRGEWPEFLGRTADGIIVMSNFRLLVRNKESFINIPLGLIESLETRDIFYLHVYCKDATVVRCAFSTNQACVDWYNRIANKTKRYTKLTEVFALCYHAWCTDRPDVDPSDSCLDLCSAAEKVESYSFTKELERLKFDVKNAWRLTELNKDFLLCASYPTEHIMPRSISDEVLKEVANFRGLHRFPSVVWRSVRNGAVLARSGQPEIGLFGWRKEEDENMLNALPLACALNPGTENRRRDRDDGSSSSDSSPEDSAAEGQDDNVPEAKTLQIVDCRSFGAAFANRAKGGGMECTDYYRSCEIEFMNLVNIHAVRKSFSGLREACKSHQDQASWLSTLDNTRWLHNIASLLKAAVYVVVKMDKEGRPVLVHCSDGWDRTSQLTSLAELLMDPYYRTAEGFKVLVEREWIYYGHKFSDRCGNGLTSETEAERSPVFVQWLECVYQIHRQFPCQFEFNEAFLVKLVHHTYSNLFGTFLCNNIKERMAYNVDASTASVWNLLNRPKFFNLLYDATAEPQVLYPATNVQNLQLWTSVYLSKNSSFAGAEDPIPLGDSDTPGLSKTRSCDNLCQNEVNSSPDRRRSDPNIATDHGEQQTQKLLKDAMSGDNSCSTESVKSSENNTVVNESIENTEESASSNTNRSDGGDAVGKDDLESPHDNDVEQNGDDVKDGDSSNVSVAQKVEESDEGVTGECVDKDVSEVPKEGSEPISTEENKVEEVNVNVNEFDDNVNENRATNLADTALGMTENGASENKLNLSNGVHEMNEPCHAESMTENPDSAIDGSAGNSIETISESEDTSDSSDGDQVQNGANEEIEGVQNGTSTSEAQEVGTSGHLVELEQQNGQPGPPAELDILERVAAIKHQQRAILVNKSTLSMESSTDTVTEGDGNQTPTPSPRSKSSSQPSPNGCGHQCINASLTSLCDKSESVTNGNRDTNLVTSELANSISTSTSDLTDSRVLGVKNGIARDHLLNGADTSLKLHMSLLGQNGRNGASRGMTVDTSLLPVVPTPNSPQSRTSTCPPTPGTSGSEGKSLESTIPRHQAIQRHLDADGLTIFNDPIQNQIMSIQRKYEQETSSLRAEVAQLRGMLAQQPHFSNGDMGIGDEDRPHGRVSPPGGSDVHSINSVTSNPASDASWDPMDDPEVHLTRWVPSFTVSNCASCGTAFGLFIRKHHCRNCGWVFCHNCCKDTIPLPHQMLHTSERVCRECYNKIMLTLDRSIMEFDSAITAPN